MKKAIVTILAVILGLLVGSIINMGIVILGGVLILPPEGVDVTNMESLAVSMHLFEPKHFLFPFLAHALGTFSGAVVTAIISKKSLIATLLIGVLFLLGGIVNIVSLPSTLWFNVVDSVLAYIPMAWLGHYVIKK